MTETKQQEDAGAGTNSLPDCERQECEQWTRVMGYFRPKSEFNKGKKSEFEERKYFSEDKANERMESLDQPFVNDFEGVKE